MKTASVHSCLFLFSLLEQQNANGFVPSSSLIRRHASIAFAKPSSLTSSLSSSSGGNFESVGGDGDQSAEQVDDDAVQWELFNKHQALGSWKGIWTTYNYIGDVIDETVGSVDYETVGVEGQQEQMVTQTHRVVLGATSRSDCSTCFDDMDVREIPVGAYGPDDMLRRNCRLASCGMAIGPKILRSKANADGIMSTELVLSHVPNRSDRENPEGGRVRVVFQHAPVWERGVEPGSCPPQGLKLFRTMVSRETLNTSGPPTPTSEEQDKMMRENNDGNEDDAVSFYRPVPPFNWHKKWAGTSWTWGPNTGNRGWHIEELDESTGDDWHGNAPVELWNLRLPGGVFVQSPRIVTGADPGLCRLAWLPNDQTLLRIEAGVTALEPMPSADDDDVMIGFLPPSLVSLRCDVLKKLGDLDGEPKFIRESQGVAIGGSNNDEDVDEDERVASAAAAAVINNDKVGVVKINKGEEAKDDAELKSLSTSEAAVTSTTTRASTASKSSASTTAATTSEKDSDNDTDVKSVRDVLQL